MNRVPVAALLFFATMLECRADDVTVLHAGQLLAVPGETARARQSVVIEGGRIARVSNGYLTRDDFADEQRAVRFIDLSEAYVLPGLIDSHVHLASSPDAHSGGNSMSGSEADMALTASRHAQIALQAGFTTVVDLGAAGIPGHENAIFAVRNAVADGTLPGSRVLAAGTPVAAIGLARAPSLRPELEPIVDRRSECSGADDCRRAVRHQIKRGSDIIVFFNTGSLLATDSVPQALTDAEMRAIVATAHRLGRKVIADGHHAPGISAAIRAGADIIDSAHLYDDGTFALLNKDVFLQSHIYGFITAVGDTPDTLHSGLWGWLPDPILVRMQRIRLRPFVVMEAYRRGFRNLAYASDAGVYRWGENAGDFVEFVSRGMSASDAILTATTNAARMLGLDDDLGTIEVGKIADIIATDGNPLADISVLGRISFVMRDGRIFRRTTAPAPAVTPAIPAGSRR